MALLGSRAAPPRVALALAAILCASGSPGALAQEPRGLAFVDAGDEPVAVSMSQDRYGEYSGRLNLAVRNDSDSGGRLRLIFIPERSGRAINLGRDSETELVRRVRPPAARMRIRAHDVRYVRLALRVPGRASLASIDGVLVAQLRPAKRNAPAVPGAELRIAGKPRQVQDVTFEPADMAIAPDCELLPGGECAGSAEVTLRGDGARRLAGDASDTDAVGILHDGSGNGVRAELGDLSQDDNGVVTGTVEISGADDPGKYAGVLSVNPGGEGSARIPLEVNVGRPIWLAILLVAAGALAAYFMRRREQVGMLRRALRDRLTVAIKRYRKARGDSDTCPASFDIEHTLGPEPWDRPNPGEPGVAALYAEIQEAQDPEDLRALEGRVKEVALEIGRWVELERGVRSARADADLPVPPLEGHDIEDTRCRTLLESRLNSAHSSGILDKCGDYLEDLGADLRLYGRLRKVWVYKWNILDRGHLLDAEVAALARIKPWALTDELPEHEGREPHALEKFQRDLAAAERRLRKVDAAVLARHPSLPTAVPKPPPRSRVSRWPGSEQAGDTPLHTQRRVERRDRGRSLWWRTRASWINWYDIVWGVAAVALASAGYAVTLWSDTWGSTADLVSAVAVGFGAKIGLDQAQQFDWTSVPFFGRLFGKPQPPIGTGATGGDGGGGDDSKVKGNGQPEPVAAGQDKTD